MERCLIALDLDGTLLTSDKRISPRTKGALQAVMKAGGDVAIATGRPPRTSVPFVRELGLTTPLINFNGALVHGHGMVDISHHTPIDYEVAMAALNVCYEIGIRNLMAEVKDEFYLHSNTCLVDPLMDVGNRAPLAVGDVRTLIASQVTSFVVSPFLDRAFELTEALQTQFHDTLTVRAWGGAHQTIEVMSNRASKASGLQQVADLLGYDAAQIIAFGDELNDLEMLQYAGTGVAMGNARDVVKSAADFVTDTCDRDGIAKFLERHVLAQLAAHS
ncbi:MAG: Cof-type HAD-IIB family hydrolase [Bacilli bacterium]